MPAPNVVRFALAAGAAALAAAVLAVALIVIRQANVGGPDASPAPTTTPTPSVTVSGTRRRPTTPPASSQSAEQ